MSWVRGGEKKMIIYMHFNLVKYRTGKWNGQYETLPVHTCERQI